MPEDVHGSPTDEELFEFTRSLLQGLGESLRSDETLRETLSIHRELWVTLYEVSTTADR